MLLLLFAGLRKALSSKDVREFSLLVNPCSTLTVFSSVTLQRIRRHICNGLGIWFLLQMTLQTFSARNLISEYPFVFYNST